MEPYPGEDDLKLRRWEVYFASSEGWYPVGEYVAVDATVAIERAIAIFGDGAGYRAEEIGWDAGPLPRPRTASKCHSNCTF